MAKRLGLQILTKQREDYLALLLSNVYNQTFKDWDLIIVNSGQPFTHYALIQLLNRIKLDGHEVTVIQVMNGTNDVGELRQVALNQDNHELGLRIDDDSMIPPTFIETLVKAFDANENVGAVGCLVPYIYEQGGYRPVPFSWNRVSTHWDTDDNSIYLYDPSTSALVYDAGHLRSTFLYKNEVAKKVGYNSGYPTGFREESDFSIRLRLSGYRVLICPHAIAWHFSAPVGNPERYNTDIKWENNIKYKRRMNEYGTRKTVSEKTS